MSDVYERGLGAKLNLSKCEGLWRAILIHNKDSVLHACHIRATYQTQAAGFLLGYIIIIMAKINYPAARQATTLNPGGRFYQFGNKRINLDVA